MAENAPKLTWKGRLIATIIGLLLLVVISEGVLRVAMPHWRDFYSARFMQMEAVPKFGAIATGRPGFNGYFAQNNGDFRVHIKINKFGLRNPEPVEDANKRIWFIGDSMAFGWGVEQKEMYSTVVKGSLDHPTYNIASPGTNVCGYQALAARMPKTTKPKAVVVGLILENDIKAYDCSSEAKVSLKNLQEESKENDRILTWFGMKRILTGSSALYNFTAVALKRVNFIREVLTTIGIIRKVDTYSQRFRADDLAIVAEKTVRELSVLKKMFSPEIPFAVLVAPARFELINDDLFYKRLRVSIVERLQSEKIASIDPYKKFKHAGYERIHFAHDGHWNALGHKLAAEEAAKWLKQNLLGKF
jgi:hypothetical protein